VISETALSMLPISSGVSFTAAAPTFSSGRCSFVVPVDRNDPRLPGQQPGDRDLSRRRLLPGSQLAELTCARLTRSASVRGMGGANGVARMRARW
jgi:hypothetical protein